MLRLILGGAIVLLNVSCATQIPETPNAANVKQVSDEESNWFRDAKFGMFIHWGLYSQTGGVWDGTKYYGITEWLMRRGKINSADYKTIAKDFNPVEFNAKEWVSIAKRSGVKYIVITAKHHDGFALFGSEASDFNIVDATPYKKDPLKELTAAARDAGIKIGFYYSQYQDWTEANASGNTWEFDEDKADFQAYLKAKAMPQLEELLTNYGPIDIIWFDTPGNMSVTDSKELKAWVKELQPNCLVSDRIGHDLGDFKGYGDGEIPAIPETGRPWEAIFTHNDSWGYSDFDNNFKSTSEVLELLVDVASKGGNLMLNVGPDGLGRLPDESVYTFLEVGKWLQVNGESIYGTNGSPLGAMPWGHITQRPGKLYSHVSHPPKNRKMIVPGIDSKVSKAYLLATGETLSVEKLHGDLYVNLPDSLPDNRNSVVVLEYQDKLLTHTEQATIVSKQYDDVTLEASFATVNGESSIKKYSTMHYFGDWKHDFTISGLTATDKQATWQIKVTEPSAYKISFNYSASASQMDQEGVMSIAGKDYFFKVLETGNFTDSVDYNRSKPLIFFDHPIAVVRFTEPGIYTLTVKPDKVDAGQELFKLKNIKFKLQD
jgi:alpha-L-fucosidase